MHLSTLTWALATTNLAAAVPFKFPLADGFPNLNSSALKEVEKLAGGTLPNGALPSKLSSAAVSTLQLIAANEIFEVAYFSELVYNITNKVSGYEMATEYDLQTLTAVVNQEQIHALAANAVLANSNATTIAPCEYDFPVSDFKSAIALAQLFTEVVLGILPLAQYQFANDGGEELGLIPVIGSIIGQEGEQTGYYRALQQKVAAAAPFLTSTGAPAFAYTAISQFFVPGSCPSTYNDIGIPTFPAITVETMPGPRDSVQLFSVNGSVSASNSSMAWISGQNAPVVVPITDVVSYGSTTYFFAEFPFETDSFARGLTLGAVVKGANASFSSAAEVGNATLFGPALIDVNYL